MEIHKDWKLQKRERRSLRDSTGLTDDEIETLRVAFVREDADRDRTLDQDEFRTLVALEIGNIEENLIDLLFRKMDDNGDGRISFFEFSLAISILGGGTPEEKLRCTDPQRLRGVCDCACACVCLRVFACVCVCSCVFVCVGDCV